MANVAACRVGSNWMHPHPLADLASDLLSKQGGGPIWHCTLHTLDLFALGVAVMQEYGCEDQEHPDELLCMGLGKFIPKQLVCGAHLFKHSWRIDVDRVLGFTNINDPANGLLLIK